MLRTKGIPVKSEQKDKKKVHYWLKRKKKKKGNNIKSYLVKCRSRYIGIHNNKMNVTSRQKIFGLVTKLHNVCKFPAYDARYIVIKIDYYLM